jgi:hypothetical protein
MNKRGENLFARLQDARDRIAKVIAAVPGSSRVSLHTTTEDNTSFIDLASKLVTATAMKANLSIIYAVHIDNWFGPRWLGFCGKTRGIAGVRNKTLKRSLSIPPFHPHRVLSARGHRLREDGLYVDAEELTSLHPHIPSESNIYRRIRSNILYAWYSGNSVATHKGVVMIYQCQQDKSQAFYTMFNGEKGWIVEQHIGITRAEVDVLLETDPRNRAT